MKSLVVAIGGEQFLVRATLHNLTIVEHANLVSILDGAESVSDGNGGACFHQTFQGILHQSLTLGVEG